LIILDGLWHLTFGATEQVENETYVVMSRWFFWSFGAGTMATFISWLVFARLSMARIERDMKRDKLTDMFAWDGVGGRIIFYAYAIVLPERIGKRIDGLLIDALLVRKYSNCADRIRGFVFLMATNIWLLIVLAGVIVGIE